MLRPSTPRRIDPTTVGLLVLRVALVIVAVRAAGVGRVSDDLQRFREIFDTPGVPYRDFVVEYAPLEVALIRLVGSSSIVILAGRVAAVALVCDVGAWAAIRQGWGDAAGKVYLVLGTPLLVFLYTRLDLVPVALAAWGAALATRERERAGGVLFAAAVLAKLWPVVLLPALWVGRHARATWWAAGALVAGGLLWFVVGGATGIEQVVTFRGATGWEAESVIGSVVWVVGGAAVRLEAGAPRVGTVPGGTTVALAILLLGLQLVVWVRAKTWGGSPFGSPAVSSVCVLLVCAPIFSLQYAAWLLPWVAVTSKDGDRRTVRLVAAVEVLTAALFVLYSPDRIVASQIAVLLRNGLVVAVPILWLTRTARAGALPGAPRKEAIPV